MEKQIYGNITNTARTQFQFDKIYPNKYIADYMCEQDGIYANRYILIDYENKDLSWYTKIVVKNGKYYFYDFQDVLAKPGETIDIGVICYAENNNKYDFYITDENGFKSIKNLFDNSYEANWTLDNEHYKRGYDSTVWQKVYYDNKQEYIMIAELNAAFPVLHISPEAPSMNPQPPMIDKKDTTDINYDFYVQPQWGMRVAEAKPNDEGFTHSDEIVSHIIQYGDDGEYFDIYDSDGNVKEEYINQVDGNIFYNKDALYKFIYKKVYIETNSNEIYKSWEKDGPFYLKRDKVYVLLDTPEKDFIIKDKNYYKEKKENEQKPLFYSDLINLEKEEKGLVDKTKDEIRYTSGTFYYVSGSSFTIATEDYDKTKTYYIGYQGHSGSTIYTPAVVTENNYIKNYYYEEEPDYKKEAADSTFVENKEYYLADENGIVIPTPLNVVDKEEYKPNFYYVFREVYYEQASGDWPEEGKVYYYEDNGEYKRVEGFTASYQPDTYFYIGEDGQYYLDTNENYDENIDNGDRYRKIAQQSVTGLDDYISILPTGMSGQVYRGGKTAKDIQEISIFLPSIGNTMCELWNLMYGKSRNDLIYSSPYHNPDMYDNNGNPKYLTDLDTIAGSLNNFLDYIGHNAIKITSKENVIENNGQYEVSNKKYSKEQVLSNLYILDNKYYRPLIKEEIIINNGQEITKNTLHFIEMFENENEYYTLLSSLEMIHRLLGTNEIPSQASLDTAIGSIARLKQIYADAITNFNIITSDDQTLEIFSDLTYEHLDGTPLIRQELWNTEGNVEGYKHATKYIPNTNYFIFEEYNDPEGLEPHFIKTNEGKYIYSEKPGEENTFKIEQVFIVVPDEVTEESNYYIRDMIYNYYYYDGYGNLCKANINNEEEEIIVKRTFDIIHAEPKETRGRSILSYEEVKEIKAEEQSQYFIKLHKINDYLNWSIDNQVSSTDSFKYSISEVTEPQENFVGDYLEKDTTGYYYPASFYNNETTYYIAQQAENGTYKKVIADNTFRKEIVTGDEKYYLQKEEIINPNKDYNIISENAINGINASTIKGIKVNEKGHIYSIDGEEKVLPQAISGNKTTYTEEKLKNYPLGTLWYEIT